MLQGQYGSQCVADCFITSAVALPLSCDLNLRKHQRPFVSWALPWLTGELLVLP